MFNNDDNDNESIEDDGKQEDVIITRVIHHCKCENHP